MNLYLITTTEPYGYDEFDAFVVAAETETAAGRFAAERANWGALVGIEASDTCWGNRERSTCVVVGTAAPDVAPGVVLASFNAG